VNFPVVLNRSVKVGAESYQRGVDLTQRYNSKVRARERTDSGIKNQIFKFRETARRQPNPFGCGGQKKQGFCCGEKPVRREAEEDWGREGGGDSALNAYPAVGSPSVDHGECN
jgi:hypothetical protein